MRCLGAPARFAYMNAYMDGVWRKPQTAESPETRMVVGSPTWARTRLLRRSTPFSHGSDHQIVEEVTIRSYNRCNDDRLPTCDES